MNNLLAIYTIFKKMRKAFASINDKNTFNS